MLILNLQLRAGTEQGAFQEGGSWSPYEWRNNLTGSSQRYNLYFVAVEDELHIYRVHFSGQRLAQIPLKMQLWPSRPGLPGYMPRTKPHAINHLCIAELGNAEVLCCAYDDGDVEAFYVHRFEEAMRKHTERAVPLEHLAAYMQSFFHVNVGASAWGLAVHKEQRLIAVSANSHLIYVFAFALVGESLPGGHQEEDLQDAWVLAQGLWLKRRQKDRFLVLQGHEANIPCITFDAKLASDESYFPRLISADITGRVVVWDVETGVKLSVLDPHHAHHDFDTMRAGWALLCLDPRSFNSADSLVAALGVCEVAEQGNISLIDISHSKQLIADNERWTIGEVETTAVETPRTLVRTSTETISPSSSSIDGVMSLDESISDQLEAPMSYAARKAIQQFKKNVAGHFHTSKYTTIDAQDCDDAGTFPLFFSKARAITSPSLHGSSGPLLLCNPHSVHLFQSLDLTQRGAGECPVIYISDPLEQHCREDLAFYLAQRDRLNLTLQIPELGVVLIGSAKGRVAVLTLHQLDEGVVQGLHAQPKLYTMKLAAVLPLSDEEALNQRPIAALVGIAAAPMRGHERGAGPLLKENRYWRIMLTYRDLTVLSYEITRDDFTKVLHV